MDKPHINIRLVVILLHQTPGREGVWKGGSASCLRCTGWILTFEMKSILAEIIEWRCAEICAGRFPTEIPLTSDQKKRRHDLIELSEMIVKVTGRDNRPQFLDLEKKIFGMKVV